MQNSQTFVKLNYLSNQHTVRDEVVLAKKRSDKLWEFFSKDRSDKQKPKATCKVIVGGAACGVVMLTPQYSTSTLRGHLNAKHPNVYKLLIAFESAWDDARARAKKDLNQFFYTVKFVNISCRPKLHILNFAKIRASDKILRIYVKVSVYASVIHVHLRIIHTQMEKKSPKKRLADEQAEISTAKKIKTPDLNLEPLPDTPSVFRKVVKHNIRAVPQLKFDMELTKMLVSCGLPFKLVNKPGFHTFIKYLDPKVSVKSNRTFMRFNIIYFASFVLVYFRINI